MASFKQVIMNSLASTVTPEAAQRRREDLSNIQRPLKRLGALTLHDIATGRPQYVASLLGITYKPNELEFLGSGWHSAVFRSEDEVIKINHRTLLLPLSEKNALAVKKQREYEAMAQVLGAFTLPQKTMIGPHPNFPEIPVIQIRQPYKEIHDPHLVEENSTLTTVATSLQGVTALQPNAREQLGVFVDGSRSLYGKREQLLPDIIGNGNLVLDEGRSIVMVDGQPTGPEEPDTQSRILRNLSYLESALAQAA